MGAGLEYLVAVIRAGPEYKSYGNEYTFVCTVLFKGDEAFILGAVGEYNRETYRQIKKALVDIHGCKKIHWEKKNNKPREVVHNFFD
jgi:hypothetical protein